MNNYYVYGFVRLDTNEFFYIGCGKESRYLQYTLEGRPLRFVNYIKGIDIATTKLIDNLTQEESFYYERLIIETLVFEYGYELSTPTNIGSLLNRTYGGSGILGYTHTKQSILKSTKYGEDNGMYGKRGELNPNYGKAKSEEHKSKIRNSNPRSKKVYCVELDRCYDSYSHAEHEILKEFNIIISHASISNIIRGRNHHGGYYVDSRKPAYLHFKLI